LFPQITALHSFVLSIFYISFGPAFIFSNVDTTGGLGFTFDVFCITLFFSCLTEPFGFELLTLPGVALVFD